MPQLWSEQEPGIFGNPELSTQSEMIAAKMCTLLDAVVPAKNPTFGKRSGDKVGVQLVARIPGRSTTSLLETQTVPFSKPNRYTATGQVFRYALAVPWTGTRQDLDRMDVEDETIRALRIHATESINGIIYNKLVSGRSFAYVATGTDASPDHNFATTGTPGASASSVFSLFHIRKMVWRAKKVNMPKYDGKNYLFFGGPTIEENLLQDTSDRGFVGISKYDPARVEGLINGEIGMVGGVRIAIDNDIIAEGIGTGSAFGSGFLIGEDACRELMVDPLHFRANMNVGGDFGNQKAIAWQILFGHLVPWNYTSHGQGSIMHYTSQ